MNIFPEFILAQVLDFCHDKNYRNVNRMWKRVLDKTVVSSLPKDFAPSRISPVVLIAAKNRYDWNNVSTKYQLSEEFMTAYPDLVDWSVASYGQKLSENLIKIHADQLDWDCLSVYQKMSESFMVEHAENINWHIISKCQRLSESFIYEYYEKLNWEWVVKFQQMDSEFVDWMEWKHYVNNNCSEYEKWWENELKTRMVVTV